MQFEGACQAPPLQFLQVQDCEVVKCYQRATFLARELLAEPTQRLSGFHVALTKSLI